MLSELECELVACQQRSREELVEMEKLLAVARREHSKAVVDVQKLTRQLARDKDWAVQTAQLDGQHLEQELQATRKKLQATFVEKNLLLVRTISFHGSNFVYNNNNINNISMELLLFLLNLFCAIAICYLHLTLVPILE